MFDVSFSELMVIAAVALVVIGPEKLPKVARTLGAFTGRIQRYIAQVKDEVNREMRFEELQKLQQEIQAQVSQVKANIQTGAQDQLAEVTQTLDDFELTPPEQKPRKLSQFNQKPAKPEILPLEPVNQKTEIEKASDKKALAKKEPAKKPAVKKTIKQKLPK